MNRQVVISSVVLFVLSMALGFFIHGMLLHGDYAQLPDLMRTETDAQAHFPFMIAGHVLMAVGLTLIYRRGREDKPWLGQGLRFGLLFAVASGIPLYLIYHAVMPFPISLVGKQIVFDTIGLLIMGVAAAALNRS